MRTPNTKCFLCQTPLYKSPNLFKKRNKFSCSNCKGEARRIYIKENPNTHKNMVKKAKSKKGTRLNPEKWVCPDCGDKKFRQSELCKSCSSKKHSGKNSHMWRGGLTKKNFLDRTKFANEVRDVVFKRDDYTCQCCNTRGGKLQVDHIQSFAEYVELRFDVNNCRTLCMACHYKITFGRELPEDVTTWGHNFSQIGG